MVCGEGRLTAFRLLGETHIPALVIEVSDEEAYIMSLVENIARRQYRPLEILASIRQLAERGYTAAEIGRKTALSAPYISGILNLLNSGEDRLLTAVERGVVPLNTALDIVGAGTIMGFSSKRKILKLINLKPNRPNVKVITVWLLNSDMVKHRKPLQNLSSSKKN